MARTIAEIKKEITDTFMADDVVRERYGIAEGATFAETFSKVSIENILFHVHAVRVWALERLFDEHVDEVTDIAERKRPHTLQWYRDKALAFQYGCELSDDSAVYDNTGMTDEEVEATMIVKKCSAQTTFAVRPTIQVKVAKEDDPLDETEMTAFRSYMSKIADAGLRVVCISGEPDRLALNLRVVYDPMVLDSDGVRLVDGSEPVKEAIAEHLGGLPFNGVFYPRLLERDLMALEGVRVAHITSARAGKYGGDLSEVEEAYEPFSGTIQCDTNNDLSVTYEAIRY